MPSEPSEKKSKSRTPNKRGAKNRVSSKKPTHVDEHVGKRLRLRRNLLGLSQDELAKRLGLTSQLIQKYEAGETRISASRLYAIAVQLAVPITWFFDELEGNPPFRSKVPKRKIGVNSSQSERRASSSNFTSALPMSACVEN